MFLSRMASKINYSPRNSVPVVLVVTGEFVVLSRPARLPTAAVSTPLARIIPVSASLMSEGVALDIATSQIHAPFLQTARPSRTALFPEVCA
jgi:hypothetical protein